MPRTDKNSAKKWFYPLVYFALTLASFLPLITEVPYNPADTQDVIMQLLMVSVLPFRSFAFIFHGLTLGFVVWMVVRPEKAGRWLAAYMGINYGVIAFAQSMGVTEEYGFVFFTGSLIGNLILAGVWLWVFAVNDLRLSLNKLGFSHLFLIFLALLAFWAPYSIEQQVIKPDFDPMLLLTSPDYGLTFCFTTPVFLTLLTLFYARVNRFAFRITAFNGLLYGLLNLTHWFKPETRWMGVLHLPLLVVSLYALIRSYSTSRTLESEAKLL